MSAPFPVLGYDFSLTGPEGWHEANRYLLWTGRFAPGAATPAVQERVADGPVTLPSRDRSLSLIPAGTPHRLAGLFGFWRRSDADLLVVRAELPEATYVCLYVSSGPQHRCDRVLWYCAGCGAELAPLDVDVRRFGARAFWDTHALAQVRAFNAAAELRTCTCGTVHHDAYGFDRDADTPPERAARALW